MYQKKNTINSRSYSVFFDIVQNTLKTINKSKGHADDFAKKHGASYLKRLDFSYIFFNDIQLRMICYDYIFSALENFLEHVGFILFNDCGRKWKQRYCREKQIKLLNFKDIIEKNTSPH